MPSVSEKQREAMAIAEHHPEKLHKENRGMLKMSHQQLHDFASHVEKRHVHGGSMHDHVFQDPSANDHHFDPSGPMSMPFDSFEYDGGGPTSSCVGAVSDQAGNALMSVHEVPSPRGMYGGDSGKFTGGSHTSGLMGHTNDASTANPAEGDPKNRNYPGDPGASSGHVPA